MVDVKKPCFYLCLKQKLYPLNCLKVKRSCNEPPKYTYIHNKQYLKAYTHILWTIIAKKGELITVMLIMCVAI